MKSNTHNLCVLNRYWYITFIKIIKVYSVPTYIMGSLSTLINITIHVRHNYVHICDLYVKRLFFCTYLRHVTVIPPRPLCLVQKLWIRHSSSSFHYHADLAVSQVKLFGINMSDLMVHDDGHYHSHNIQEILCKQIQMIWL